MKTIFIEHKEKIIAALLWLIVFTTYLQTLAPTVGFIDSGELAAVALTLGIAHPTGYPLFTLLGRFFSLFPVAAEEIVRLNIFSAFCVASGIAVFFFMLLEFIGDGKKHYARLMGSTFASLSLAFSQTVWSQALGIEVYSLHVLLLSLILLLFAKAIRTDEPRWWLMFAFVTGLSFTNHMTTILLAPALLYWFFVEHGLNKSAFKKMMKLSLPFLFGMSVYLFLPIRAAQQPPFNWGNPQTFEKFWWHISGKQFRVWMFSSSDVAAKQLNYFFERLPIEFFYFPLLLALIGAIVLLFSKRRKFVVVLLLFAGCVGYSINYDIHDIDSYFILAFIAVAIASAFGIVKVSEQFSSKTGKWIPIAAVAACCFVQINANWRAADASDQYLVEDYSKTILMNLPENSIVISTQWDYFVSASYYFQHIKNLRPDIVVLDKELFRRSWYFPQLEAMYPDVMQKSKIESELFQKELYKFEHDEPYQFEVIEGRYINLIKSFIDKNIDSVPVFVTPEIEPQYTAGYLRIPEVYLLRLSKDSTYLSTPFPDLKMRHLGDSDKYSNNLRQLAANALAKRGIYEQHFGNDSLAQLYFSRSRDFISPKSSPISNF
ncbi:MAG: DUF2723 domain-containing protein [Bacteroidota bacterium]